MRDESDQKELVLGNKQLLSIFFIVIAMLGVAFTLGYMIGRNTANVSAAGVSSGSSVAASAASPSRPMESPVAPAEEAPAAVVAPPRAKGTSRAKPYETETGPAPTVTPTPVKPLVTTAAAGNGTYLQVAAMKRPDAEHMVSVLRDRGFPALVGESPKEGLFRVLVGPYKDNVAISDAKTKLRAAGFENPLIAR